MILKESLFQGVKGNNKQIEVRVNQVMNVNRTYKQTLENIQTFGETLSRPTEETDFRTIMLEARNEELAEESVKKLRPSNIILHGVKEVINDKEKAKKTWTKNM